MLQGPRAPPYEALLSPLICGASITAADGQFLGKVSGNSVGPDSIINRTGSYGSDAGAASIWNPYGQYGSPQGWESAFNDYALAPPRLIKNDVDLGFVTTATYHPLRVHPLELKEWLDDGNCAYE